MKSPFTQKIVCRFCSRQWKSCVGTLVVQVISNCSSPFGRRPSKLLLPDRNRKTIDLVPPVGVKSPLGQTGRNTASKRRLVGLFLNVPFFWFTSYVLRVIWGLVEDCLSDWTRICSSSSNVCWRHLNRGKCKIPELFTRVFFLQRLLPSQETNFYCLTLLTYLLSLSVSLSVCFHLSRRNVALCVQEV